LIRYLRLRDVRNSSPIRLDEEFPRVSDEAGASLSAMQYLLQAFGAAPLVTVMSPKLGVWFFLPTPTVMKSQDKTPPFLSRLFFECSSFCCHLLSVPLHFWCLPRAILAPERIYVLVHPSKADVSDAIPLGEHLGVLRFCALAVLSGR